MSRKTVLWALVAALIATTIGWSPIAKVFALGTPRIVSIDPPSPSPVGTCVKVHYQVDWDNEFDAMRAWFGSDGPHETGAADMERQFCTGGWSPGWYTIRVEARRKGDNSWSSPTSTQVQYELTGGAPQPPPPTSPPSAPGFSRLELDRGSANAGEAVNIFIKVDSANPGAIRTIPSCGGVSHYEHTTVEFTNAWNTGGCGGGTQNVQVCARAVGDNDWSRANCQTLYLTITVPPAAIEPANGRLWAEPGTIQQGQCTTLKWWTTSVDANSVTLDSQPIGSGGEKQVCPPITTNYGLKATGLNGQELRLSTNVVVNASSQPQPQFPFQNCGLIQIGYDMFVIQNSQRRLVPNPYTLDQLGLGRDRVNNQGWSESQLSGIPRGQDIPDAARDWNGFSAFKSQCFSNLSPIQPGATSKPPVTQPTSSAPSTDGDCSRALPTQFTIGKRGRVTFTDGTPTSLRESPIKTSRLLRSMPEGHEFDVIDGPTCNGGQRWWKLRTQEGLVGWAMEGSGFYYIEPLSSQSQPKPTQFKPTQIAQGQPKPTQKPSAPVAPQVGQTTANEEVAGPGFDQGIEPEGGIVPSVNASSAEGLFTPGQCTHFVAQKRQDVAWWIGDERPRDARVWDDRAVANGGSYGIYVDKTPKAGDIVVFNSGCSVAPAGQGGHVAYVTSVGNGTITVEEQNVPLGAGPRVHTYTLKGCEFFIHQPSIQQTQPPQQPTTQVDVCAKYTGLRWLLCKLGWH